MGDTKSLSPPTSVSEISADAEPRVEDQTPCLKMETELHQQLNLELDLELNMETELNMEPDLKMESDVKLETDLEMESETEHKASPVPTEDRLTDFSLDVVILDDQSTPTDASQDSSQTINPSSPEIPVMSDDDKVIPRLVNTSVPLDVLNSMDPEHWTTSDVAKFLTVNDCQPYCINFSHITGSMMLQLSKDEIIELLEMKVGPSLKIFDLIQQLKCKIKQPQCRLLGSFK